MNGLPTKFEEVFEIYLQRITSFDLVGLTQDEMMLDLTQKLRMATNRFLTKEDLTLDLANSQFNRELDDMEIDIISLWMIVEWVKPKIYSEEKMESRMTAKEYNVSTGSSLLNQLRLIKSESEKEANLYSNRLGIHRKAKKRKQMVVSNGI